MGLRKTKFMNQALLMKVGWGLINQKDTLWARTLRNKYGCGDGTIPRVTRKNNSSNLWQGICKVWKNVERGSSWKLGNGCSINFWKDSWSKKDFYLRDVATGPLDDSDLNKHVSDYLLPNGDWNLAKLRLLLPQDICEWIVRTYPGGRGDMEDRLAWKYPKDVNFTVKSAYSQISEEDANILQKH